MIKKYIKLIRLSNPFNWYLDAEWDWSLEMDGLRKPRRFFKNKYYKDEFIITEVYNNPELRFSKHKLVKIFMKEYKNSDLIGNECCYVINTEKNYKRIT